MKKLTKLFLSLAVLLLSVGFIGCKEPDSADNKKRDVVFATEPRNYDGTNTAIISYIFKTDGTYVSRNDVSDGSGYDTSAGTYTGDPSKDGVITITIKKLFKGSNLEDCEEPYDTEEITITDGQFSMSSVVFTRQ